MPTSSRQENIASGEHSIDAISIPQLCVKADNYCAITAYIRKPRPSKIEDCLGASWRYKMFRLYPE
jgi:hypothetical protein